MFKRIVLAISLLALPSTIGTMLLAPEAQALSARQMFTYGFRYYKQNKFPQAAYWFRRGLRVEPGNADAHFLLGDSYRRMGRTKLAQHHYNRSLKLAPNGRYAQQARTLVQGYAKLDASTKKLKQDVATLKRQRAAANPGCHSRVPENLEYYANCFRVFSWETTTKGQILRVLGAPTKTTKNDSFRDSLKFEMIFYYKKSREPSDKIASFIGLVYFVGYSFNYKNKLRSAQISFGENKVKITKNLVLPSSVSIIRDFLRDNYRKNMVEISSGSSTYFYISFDGMQIDISCYTDGKCKNISFFKSNKSAQKIKKDAIAYQVFIRATEYAEQKKMRRAFYFLKKHNRFYPKGWELSG